MPSPLPSDPPSADEPCFAALQGAILLGSLAPGDRLPPERSLAEQFGVNRVTVRTALSRLAARKLVAARQGSGYRVLDFWASGGPELLPGLAALAQEQGELPRLAADLLLVRRSLAQAVFERLQAEPPSAVAVAQVEVEVIAFAAAVARDACPEELAGADLAILRALLAATGSPVLGLCLNPIAAALDALPALRAAIYVDPPANEQGWRALLAWLRAPDAAPLSAITALLQERDAATVRRLGGAA